MEYFNYPDGEQRPCSRKLMFKVYFASFINETWWLNCLCHLPNFGLWLLTWSLMHGLKLWYFITNLQKGNVMGIFHKHIFHRTTCPMENTLQRYYIPTYVVATYIPLLHCYCAMHQQMQRLTYQNLENKNTTQFPSNLNCVWKSLVNGLSLPLLPTTKTKER